MKKLLTVFQDEHDVSAAKQVMIMSHTFYRTNPELDPTERDMESKYV